MKLIRVTSSDYSIKQLIHICIQELTTMSGHQKSELPVASCPLPIQERNHL